MTLEELLKSHRELCERATLGPWYPCGARYTMISRDISDQEVEDIAEVCNHFRDEAQIEMNKQFIADSRELLPRYIEALKLALYWVDGDSAHDIVSEKVRRVLRGEK